MAKKILISLVALIVLLGVIGGIKGMQIGALIAAGKSMVAPAETISTAEVRSEHWEPTIDAVGSVVAAQGVVLGAEVSGTVTKIAFESGTTVKAGDLLVEIDTSVEQAQLAAAEAQAALANLSLQRAKDLRAKNTNSQADLDAADAQAKEAAAQVANIRATIAKKTIRAPFAGRLGIRLVNLGQYLAAGTPIVSLQALQPVYVNLSLPQQRLGQLAIGLAARVTSDAYPGRAFEGKITAINPDIDLATRSVTVQLTLANEQELLRPGMFANVAVILPSKENLIVIPATAVLFAPYGDTVFVVEKKQDEQTSEEQLVVRQQFVRLGVRRGDFVAVTEGLKPGETIVGTGAFKLRNGARVTVNNDLAPKPSLTPTPAEG
ncbi:efflux RND transporter periplasmic adaptor subunit [Opitutaceae bacterium TAV4]|uniref:efflux RND transporter periplasmic adaptor subunit n=1 Tax=Geminisphaera colitermitum TaxID=1148786 RepID=UPI000158D081|nr:efflux RND transporter periplasmic adaptor subunit [Geminisphaera colitermitum]RRJ98162.1 efflux RND transporter periplasmic adaptor subunit [Opitutaceae bacterium TAV4]RRK02735.1 efflux RND transporter periplasmic adaptor subunit [Opitutaceae bacterium TAV3]